LSTVFGGAEATKTQLRATPFTSRQTRPAPGSPFPP